MHIVTPIFPSLVHYCDRKLCRLHMYSPITNYDFFMNSYLFVKITIKNLVIRCGNESSMAVVKIVACVHPGMTCFGLGLISYFD